MPMWRPARRISCGRAVMTISSVSSGLRKTEVPGSTPLELHLQNGRQVTPSAETDTVALPHRHFSRSEEPAATCAASSYTKENSLPASLSTALGTAACALRCSVAGRQVMASRDSAISISLSLWYSVQQSFF